jgi:type I restriction enzyme S subunit
MNNRAHLKESGVAWLGNVPASWSVMHLKRLCLLITDGAHISPDTEGGSYHFVSTKDIVNDDINFDGCLLTSQASYEYLSKTGCRPIAGDVLFSKDGTIGRSVVVRENREFVVASSLIIIRPDISRLHPDYLNYLCKSLVVSCQVERFVKGAGLPRLSIQNLLKVIGVFPPIDEQCAIVTLLNKEISKLETLEAETEHVIGLLKERRSALIAATVTGKLDVCGGQSLLEAAA